MSSIAAGTTTTTGYVVTSDSTGALVLKTGASATTAVTIGSDQSVTFAGSQTFSGGTANGVLYLNGSKVATSGSALTFDGVGGFGIGGATPRILSNMSGTQSTRFAIQNSTTNGNTRFFLYPNGTGTISAINGRNNSDVVATDWQEFDLGVIASTDVRLSSSAAGSLTALPITFYIGGSEQMRLTSTGLGIGTSSPDAKLQVAGNATIGSYVAATNVSLNFNGVASKAKRIIFKTSGTESWLIGMGAASETDAFEIYNGNGQMALSIAKSNSQATFNSSVSGKNLETVSSGTASYVYNTASGGSAVFGQDSTGTLVADLGTKPIYFYTNSAERARITSSGNFGIGTSSPQYRLSLGTAVGRKLAIYDDGTSGGVAAGFGTDMGGSSYELSSWSGSPGGGNGVFTWGQVNTTNGAFTERMRINTNGDLLVGATGFASGGITKTIVSAGSSSAGFQIQLSGAVASYIYGYTSGSVGFRVETSGTYPIIHMVPGSNGVQLTSGATSWTSLSDERTKTDLVPITDAVQKVSSLRAVTGRFIKDDPETSRSFLIAQDFVDVFPQAVSTFKEKDDDTEYLGLAYTDTIPLLVAAIKEQQALIETLTQRITALEGR